MNLIQAVKLLHTLQECVSEDYKIQINDQTLDGSYYVEPKTKRIILYTESEE